MENLNRTQSQTSLCKQAGTGGGGEEETLPNISTHTTQTQCTHALVPKGHQPTAMGRLSCLGFCLFHSQFYSMSFGALVAKIYIKKKDFTS